MKIPLSSYRVLLCSLIALVWIERASLCAQIDSARLPMKSLTVGNRWIYMASQYQASNGQRNNTKIVEYVAKDTLIRQNKYAVIKSIDNNSARYERATDSTLLEWKNNEELVIQKWSIQSNQAITFQHSSLLGTRGFSPQRSSGLSVTTTVTKTSGYLNFLGEEQASPPILNGVSQLTISAQYVKNKGLITAKESFNHSTFRLNYSKSITLIGSFIDGAALGDTISNLDIIRFNVYPNPVSDILFVELLLMRGQDVTIRLINTNGTVVYEKGYEDIQALDKSMVKIGDLPQGLYILSVATSTQNLSKPIIISR